MLKRAISIIILILFFPIFAAWKLKEVWEHALGILIIGALSIGLFLKLDPLDDFSIRLIVLFCAICIAVGVIVAWAHSGTGFRSFVSYVKFRLGVALGISAFILVVPSPSSASVRYAITAVLWCMMVAPIRTVFREMRDLPHEFVSYWRP